MNTSKMLVNFTTATLPFEINKASDLSPLKALINHIGLKFDVDDGNDWADLSEAEIEG